MTTKLSVAIGFLALVLQTPTPTASPKPAASSPPATQGAGTTANRPGALVLTVLNEKGEPLTGASVAVRGAADRSGTTGTDGAVTLQNIPVGTVRVRVTRDGFMTLEKEVSIRSAARTTSEAVLSMAPPAPAPPPTPTPTPTPESRPMTPAGALGTPKMSFVTDLVDQMLKDSQPVVTRQVGCSGVMETSLILTRENISHRHTDVDETIYIVAGEGSLTVADKNQNIEGGWFGFVPRGVPHSITRRGRNPMVLLVVTSGKPCENGTK